MERESFVDFLRRLEKEILSMKEAFEEIYEAVCVADEDPEEEIERSILCRTSKHHTFDFMCSCRSFLRLDLVPWYTSGFE